MAERFGQILRKARKQTRKTLRELSDASGLAISYISDIEHGRKNPPRSEAIRKMQDVLNISGNILIDAANRELKVSKEIDVNMKNLINKRPALSVLSLLRVTADMDEDEFSLLVNSLEKRKEL
ncbi:MAG: helix-turn-helix domain-containing protein [Pedobacter sp.]